MKHTCLVALAIAAMTWPAHAVTVSNGVVLFNQADALAGNVTAGDTPGFPVTLSVSGTYRLAGNLAPSPGKDGISVTAPEVTIDLFGFRIAGSGTARHGINATQRALSVSNGTIRGFMTDGILTTAEQLIVDRMRISDNRGFGIVQDLSNSAGSVTIANSQIIRNGYGISCADSCSVQGSTLSHNDETGIVIRGNGGTVLGNTISYNTTGIFNNNAGIGNNTLFGNTTSIVGTYLPLVPNVCSPAC